VTRWQVSSAACRRESILRPLTDLLNAASICTMSLLACGATTESSDPRMRGDRRRDGRREVISFVNTADQAGKRDDGVARASMCNHNAKSTISVR
jgi:hypothetical protein